MILLSLLQIQPLQSFLSLILPPVSFLLQTLRLESSLVKVALAAACELCYIDHVLCVCAVFLKAYCCANT